MNDLIEDEYRSFWFATVSGLYRRWSDGSAARYASAQLAGQRYANLDRSYDLLHNVTKNRHRMRRRAGPLGASLDVVSAARAGTSVRFRMPIRETALAAQPTSKGR